MITLSLQERIQRGDRILKLFEEQRLSAKTLAERFSMRETQIFEAMRHARLRRKRAKEKAE